jgi:hypothetical protein
VIIANLFFNCRDNSKETINYTSIVEVEDQINEHFNIVMAPTIHDKIRGTGLVLSGFMTEKEAKIMASILAPSE